MRHADGIVAWRMTHLEPNDQRRRAARASWGIVAVMVGLSAAFFRTQVVRSAAYRQGAEANRLRVVPSPAPRGPIYDRRGRLLADNVPGHAVFLMASSEQTLLDALVRLDRLVPVSPELRVAVRRRYLRAPQQPVLVLGDVEFAVLSALEERRGQLPELVIQTVPKRRYPAGAASAAITGYTSEATDRELSGASGAKLGIALGELVGRGGLEQQYDSLLRGVAGSRSTEVDARGRSVRQMGALALPPRPGVALQTTIDLELQQFVAGLFGDSLRGGAIAMDPRSGEVLALHSAPSFDPNRFVGGIPPDYWAALNTDARRPLFNKVLQARYAPASTWKLATAVLALQSGAIDLGTHMPIPDRGGLWYGGRFFRDWYRPGHGDIDLTTAIEVSCNVYFYQLGLKLGLPQLLRGGVALGFRNRTGIDLPNEAAPHFPADIGYYDRRYGAGGWSNAAVLNLAIGQGENDQTLVSMARFYTALATDGRAAQPTLTRRPPVRTPLFQLSPAQLKGLRGALAGVVSARGTAGASRLESVTLAGKTGTAQNAQAPDQDHAWFVGFAPAEQPDLVVAVVLEFGEHGSRAARIASRIVERHHLLESGRHRSGAAVDRGDP